MCKLVAIGLACCLVCGCEGKKPETTIDPGAFEAMRASSHPDYNARPDSAVWIDESGDRWDYDKGAGKWCGPWYSSEPETVRVWPGQTEHFLSLPNLVVIGIPEPPPCYHAYEVDVKCALCGETVHVKKVFGTKVALVNGQRVWKGGSPK